MKKTNHKVDAKIYKNTSEDKATRSKYEFSKEKEKEKWEGKEMQKKLGNFRRKPN